MSAQLSGASEASMRAQRANRGVERSETPSELRLGRCEPRIAGSGDIVLGLPAQYRSDWRGAEGRVERSETPTDDTARVALAWRGARMLSHPS
jgi:hypothetical protein